MEQPYLTEEVVTKTKVIKQNPNHDEFAVCTCGHAYYNHFDSKGAARPCYECKECLRFVEKPKPKVKFETDSKVLLETVVANLMLRRCKRCGHFNMPQYVCFECGFDDSIGFDDE